jgi:dihydroorotate dehydrogenase (NAD+) catalytic subunit
VILNASGCLDALTAPEVAKQLDAFVTKTVTPLPREGNEPVRIAETDVGMLNSIGLANPGIERFAEDVLPRLAELGVPIWVSVAGFSASEYADLCAALDGRVEVATIELNVSCPNVASPEDEVEEIVVAARDATSKPLYAKLSPAVPDIGAVAAAAEKAGADGLSLVNTLRGLAIDGRTLAPKLSTATGGLSGPALRPVALAAVFAARTATRLPIVGMGGSPLRERTLVRWEPCSSRTRTRRGACVKSSLPSWRNVALHHPFRRAPSRTRTVMESFALLPRRRTRRCQVRNVSVVEAERSERLARKTCT